MVAPFINSAVVYASLFGFMALGLTLTYLTTKVPNFAYGSFVTIGLYTSYSLFKIYKVNPYLAGPVAFLLSGAVSVVMYLLVLRPLARKGSSIVSLMIATFGVDIGFTGIFGIYTDYVQAHYGLSDAKQFFQLQADFTLGGVAGIVYTAPILLAVVTAGLYLLLSRTRFGIAMRASVENPSLARVLGINTERVNIVSWMLAGGFAGLAGVLFTMWLPGGTNTGSDLIVEIFAASVLGGLTSIFGAILGGLMIGGSEIILGVDLATGFGALGAGVLGVLTALVGVYLVRKKRTRMKALGIISLAFGVYVLANVIVGPSLGFMGPGLIGGFGAQAIEYQKGIPLIIMVVTLLILPTGLVSVNWRRVFRLEKKS